jgi:hypothetical protein
VSVETRLRQGQGKEYGGVGRDLLLSGIFMTLRTGTVSGALRSDEHHKPGPENTRAPARIW